MRPTTLNPFTWFLPFLKGPAVKRLLLSWVVVWMMVPAALAQIDTTPPVDTPAAPPKPPLYLEFVLEKKDHSPDSLYFNVLKAVNNTSSTVTGNLRLLMPGDWTPLTPRSTPVTIEPGNAFYFPVRIKLNRKLKGGQTYLLTGGLDREDKRRITTNTYINIPKKSKLYISTREKTIYFNKQETEAKMYVDISNQGNGDELVRLNMNIGSNLLVRGPNNYTDVAFIPVPPGVDTTVVFYVAEVRNNKITDEQLDSWDSYTVQVDATGGNKKDTRNNFHVWFRSLDSEYTNTLKDPRSPLNVQVMAQNILADFTPTVNFNAFGTVLLKNKREVNYRFNHPNIVIFGNNQSPYPYGEHLWRLSRMQVNYIRPGFELGIGDQADGMDQVIFGRGIRTRINYNKHYVSLAALRNVLLPIDGGNATYGYQFNRSVGLRAGITYQNDEANLINSGTGTVEGTFMLLRRHHLRAQVSYSQRTHTYDSLSFPINDTLFNEVDDPDTTLTGFGYQMNYNYNFRKLRIGIRNSFGSQNHSGLFGGRFEMNGFANYSLNDKTNLFLRYIRFDFDPAFYRSGRLLPTNERFTETADLQAIRTLTRGVTLGIGPQVERLGTSQFDQIRQRDIGTTTLSTRGMARLNINMNRYSNISPQIAMGYTFITDVDQQLLDDLNVDPDRTDGFFHARALITVRQRIWGVNAAYFFGPSNIFTQSSFVYSNNFNKSIQIRPYYDNFIHKDKIRLQSYSSYVFNTGTNVENLALNANLSFILGKGWTIRWINNLFFFNREDPELGSVSNRLYTMHAGFNKKFDWEQPRVKYHDLRIVFFQDENGNRILDENEILLDNIMANITQAQGDSLPEPVGNFVEKELVSNDFGEVHYYEMPEGTYDVDMLPLKNLRDLYNINGAQQQFTIFEDMTYYVPFAQSYKVVGKVSVERDKFSNSGLISIADIRVTVTDPDGRKFSSLTDVNGHFVIYVPQNSGYHTVKVNNVLGEKFTLEQDEFIVNFNGYKIFEVDFKFMERKRKIKFNNGGAENFFRNGPTSTPENGTGGQSNTGQNPGGIPPAIRPTVPAPGSSSGNQGNTNQPAGFTTPSGNTGNSGATNTTGGTTQPNASQPAGVNTSNANALPFDTPLPPNNESTRRRFKNSVVDPALSGDALRQQLNQILTPNALDNDTRPIKKDRIGFRVVIGVFTEQMPTDLLNNLISLGYKNEGIPRDDGSTQFVSSKFTNVYEAEQYQRELDAQGFTGADIIGDYNGVTITRSQAETMLNE